MDVRGLSQAIGIREKEVVFHLPHVSKSVAAKGMTFVVQPAYCGSCNFTFTRRQRLSAPTKCPHCRQSRILGPWYQVTVETNKPEKQS